MKTGIYVGAPSAESIKSATTAILAILDARADEKTKRIALRCLKANVTSPHHCNFSDISISMPTNKVDSTNEDVE